MKTQNFKLLLLILLLASFQLHAERITKRIYKSFPVSQVSKLELSNKYGNIQIDDNRKDSVVIDVLVWVDGTGSRSQRVLDNIEVNINTSGIQSLPPLISKTTSTITIRISALITMFLFRPTAT